MDKIDNLDKKILSILSKNARIPFKDVAAECGVSRAAIHQRVQHLIQGGVITGSGFDVNPKSIGYTTCTYVGLNLERRARLLDVFCVRLISPRPAYLPANRRRRCYPVYAGTRGRNNTDGWRGRQPAVGRRTAFHQAASHQCRSRPA